ncbi:MAG: CBS domain-containing protein [Ardenticatenaceae bacterium]
MNVILSHDHTDFDAVASQLGAWKLFPEWTPLVGSKLNSNVRHFLTLYWGALPFRYAVDVPSKSVIEEAMLVDTQRLPKLKGLNTQQIPQVRVIDHHPLRDGLPEHWNIELHERGSCATVFVEMIAQQQLPLSWVEATLLLLGIHEDTGSLVYESTSPRDAWAVAWLLEQGAHLDTLRDFLEHPLTEQQRELYRKLLENSRFLDLHGFQIVIAYATTDKYVKQISSLAHSLLDLYDPAALLLAVEMKRKRKSKGGVQLVARSTTSDIDVGNLMKRFGGGGHTRAAAAFVDYDDYDSVDEVVEQLKSLLPEHVQPADRVRDWMSRGKIRSFVPTMRIKNAAALMQRWGHEGFPVVDKNGNVVGMLTRRDVDRALQHKLHNAPINQFMHKGNLVVTPQDSIAHVQRLMTERNIGQVPVVEADTGQMIGIITRTDLLRRIGYPRLDRRAKALMEKLGSSLSESTFALVRYIGQEAHAMGYRCYLVGGIVRDMLLDKPMKDLDIVIEGHAIKLAQRLAEALGGRVVAHKRFGTAKWIVNTNPKLSSHIKPLSRSAEQMAEGARSNDFSRSGAPRTTEVVTTGAPRTTEVVTTGTPRTTEVVTTSLPEHIDLITARTEFYERPTALPQVEHASIKQDLLRRDFTINTLALSLDPDHEGQLLDFFGGEADLGRGLIRVLHNLSFVEDPTRILRAIRFEQRFGFTLDSRTEELLLGSLDLLEELSPDRVRHELWLILQEQEPAAALRRMHELGVMPFVLPTVDWDESINKRFEQLRTAEQNSPESLLAALIWSPTAEPAKQAKKRINRITKTLALSRTLRDRLHSLYTVRSEQKELTAPQLPNSTLYKQLHKRDAWSLDILATLTENDPLRQRLRLFLDDLRHRKSVISGQDLRASGLPPGPAYKRILNTIHAAMLDGTAPDEAAQRELMMAEIDRIVNSKQ